MPVPSPANIDVSAAKRFASFNDLLDTATETVDGIRRYLPSKVMVGPGRSGADATTDQLLQLGFQCIGAAEASSPPTLSDTTIAAAVQGGTSEEIAERIRTAVLRATTEYLWRSNDEGGMRSVPGFLVWPTALGARTPSATPSVGGRPPPKGRATSEAGSESASGKRRRRDLPDNVDDLYDHLRGGGQQNPARPGSVVGSSGGGGAKKPLLMAFTLPKQVSVSRVCFVCWCSGHAPPMTPP